MRKSLALFLSTFLIVITINALAQEKQQQIQRYLDSCTKYLKKKRPDLVVQFNLKADTLISSNDTVPFSFINQIQSNYIWAFGVTNRQEQKKYHIKKFIKIIKEEEKKHGVSLFVHYHLSLGNLAAVFNQSGQLDSAKKYFELAIKLAKENKDTLFYSSALNNMGLFMVKYKNWDSAKIYFDQALEILQIRTDRDSVLYCSIKDNLADFYFHKNDSIEGTRLVEENMRFLNPSRRASEKMMYWGQKLVEIYIAKRRFRLADSLINRLKLLLDDVAVNWKYENTSKLLHYESEIANLRGNKQQIDSLSKIQISFLDEYIFYLNERNASINKLVSEYGVHSVDRELKASAEEVQDAKRREERNIILFFALLIISALIVSLLVTNYKRRIKIEHRDSELNAKKLEIERLEKDKFRFELENKSKDFSNLLMQSTLQEDWSKYLIEKLKLIGKKENEEGKSELKELILELRQKAGMYEKIHELQKGMEEANTNFFKTISSKFPTLTEAEKETCGLIRMNMKSKEIALIRNINPSSVRKLRQRIRAKLRLEATEDLYTFIQDI